MYPRLSFFPRGMRMTSVLAQWRSRESARRSFSEVKKQAEQHSGESYQSPATVIAMEGVFLRGKNYSQTFGDFVNNKRYIDPSKYQSLCQEDKWSLDEILFSYTGCYALHQNYISVDDFLAIPLDGRKCAAGARERGLC